MSNTLLIEIVASHYRKDISFEDREIRFCFRERACSHGPLDPEHSHELAGDDAC